MTITQKGAWFVSYRMGLSGTHGESLDSDSDNLGWALSGWKHALAYSGFGGTMTITSPSLGPAADKAIRAFQEAKGLGVDGVIGRRTGRALVMPYAEAEAAAYGLPLEMVAGIISHESGFDLGAIGYSDTGDRGCTQKHLSTAIAATLSQAIRPLWSIRNLASHTHRMRGLLGDRAAIASWNVGEGGAEWWHDAGEPATGSPAWWDESKYGSLAKRATDYVAAVEAFQ